MMILAIGKDLSTHPEDRGSYDSGTADVIRLIRIDFVSGEVIILPVPRDLWVPIPGMEVHGVEVNQLRIAYSYGYTYFGEGHGPLLVADTLAHNFDLAIDHYVVLNTAAFVEGIDAIGGVDIYLPEDIVVDAHNDVYLTKGYHHFDGREALGYVRARPDNSRELERILRQTDLIEAVKEKVFSPAVFPSVPRIVQSMRRSVLTDLSPADISSLMCLSRNINTDDIQTVPYDISTFEEIVSRGGNEILAPNYETTTEFFDEFENGLLSPVE
jgi:LCP family protein required for cell wall assembly